MIRIALTLAGLVAAMAVPGRAGAAERTVGWTPPTHCEDGTEIGSANCGPLIQYRLQCNHNGTGAPYTDFEWFIDAPASSDTRDYPPNDYWCRLSVNNANGWSKWSVGELAFSEAAPPSVPDRPTDLTVTEANLVAYAIVESTDKVTLLPVGEVVAAGIECDSTQPVLGKFVIARDDVLFFGDVQPAVVVAECSG